VTNDFSCWNSLLLYIKKTAENIKVYFLQNDWDRFPILSSQVLSKAENDRHLSMLILIGFHGGRCMVSKK
jgi:hypothetical protein